MKTVLKDCLETLDKLRTINPYFTVINVTRYFEKNHTRKFKFIITNKHIRCDEPYTNAIFRRLKKEYGVTYPMINNYLVGQILRSL